MPSNSTVFVIDDDTSVRDSIITLLRSVDQAAQGFTNGEDFLNQYEETRPGCVVLDVRMPGISGMTVLKQLASRRVSLPTIVITGFPDVTLAVSAMRNGALDFLLKPFQPEKLLSRIREAIGLSERMLRKRVLFEDIDARLSALSEREREVLDLVVLGNANKVIAFRLGVTQKTIEFHRAKIMKKLHVKSLAELVRLVGKFLDRELDGPESDG